MIKHCLFTILGTLFVSILFSSTLAQGADGKANPKVLDFEADLIEGERTAPNVFIEIEPHRPGLDLILYQRNNFNDFHASEKNRRPRYISGRSVPTLGAVGRSSPQQQQKKGK